MRRRKLFGGLAAGLVMALLPLACVVLLRPDPEGASQITMANFRLIKSGMSREQVEAILGAPKWTRTTKPFPDMEPFPWAGWESKNLDIDVMYDYDGRVMDANQWDKRSGPLETMRKSWRKWFPE